jgi:NADH:ubiquinone oxidoreductase subunit 3 (subunit A)
VRGAGLIMALIGIGILILIFFFVAILYNYFFARKGLMPMFRDFYECGFKAIPDNRINIDLQYGNILIIFLVYDMEIIFFSPVLVNSNSLTYFSIYTALLVIGVLGLSY